MNRFILSIGMLCLILTTNAQNRYECTYWFDGDATSATIISVEGDKWIADIDVSSLSNTLHTIYLHVSDAEGMYSPVVTKYFIRMADNTPKKYRYWFDADMLSMQESNDGALWLNVEELTNGLHTLHVQLKTEDDKFTQVETERFVKVQLTDGREPIICNCYTDGELKHSEKILSADGVFDWDVDVKSLSRGLHFMEVQSLDSDGTITSIHCSLFLRIPTDEELSSLRCFYIIDDSLTNIVEGTYEDYGYHFELDVTELPDGEHRITYMLVDDKEVVTDMQSATFIKESDGEGISVLINDKEETLLYDISGRRVTGPLTRGVYIINGRKVLIK